MQLLGLLQELAKAADQDEVLVQLVTAADGEGRLLAGLSGLLKTAHQEHPRIRGQVIGIEAECATPDLVARLRGDRRRPQDAEIVYRAGARMVASWSEEAAPMVAPQMPWRAGGVYLVTGGAGGLGLLVARSIAQRAPGARIVLTGRTELGAERTAVLRELEASGAQVVSRLTGSAPS